MATWWTPEENEEFSRNYQVVSDAIHQAFDFDPSGDPNATQPVFDALADILGQANRWGQAKVRAEQE